MKLRLGQVLMDAGMLNAEQVAQVLERQRRDQKPFGLLCERMFGLAPEVIEEAWAQQYATVTRTIDPELEVFEPQALELISRRQAWQFRVLPIRFDDTELMLATTPMHLRRALRFASELIQVPLYIVMADAERLGQALCKHYPLPGMTPQSVTDWAMDDLLAAVTGRKAG